MKITKRQLRRIIRESLEQISHEEVVTYLTDRAQQYHSDRSLVPPAIRTLLMDDFMDDLGHVVSISDYVDLIDELSTTSSTDWAAEELADEADYNDGVADAQDGLPIRKDASPAYLDGWAEGSGEL